MASATTATPVTQEQQRQQKHPQQQQQQQTPKLPQPAVDKVRQLLYRRLKVRLRQLFCYLLQCNHALLVLGWRLTDTLTNFHVERP